MTCCKWKWNKRPVGLSSFVNCPPVVALFLTQRQLSINAGWQHMGRVPHPNYVDRECCVATVCHQVRFMYWEHLGHFQKAISHLKWHKIVCMRYLACAFSQMKSTDMFSMYLQSGVIQTFHMVIYCGLNIKLHCFHVYVCQCWPQTLATICRNMGIWDVFMLHPPRKIYLGFVAFAGTVPTRSDSNLTPYVTPLLTHWSYVFVGLAYRFTIFP